MLKMGQLTRVKPCQLTSCHLSTYQLILINIYVPINTWSTTSQVKNSSGQVTSSQFIIYSLYYSLIHNQKIAYLSFVRNGGT